MKDENFACLVKGHKPLDHEYGPHHHSPICEWCGEIVAWDSSSHQWGLFNKVRGDKYDPEKERELGEKDRPYIDAYDDQVERHEFSENLEYRILELEDFNDPYW